MTLPSATETVCRAALAWANGSDSAAEIREAVEFLRAHVRDMDEGGKPAEEVQE